MSNLIKYFFVFLPLLGIGQHTIKGTFSPASDYEWVLLYKVSPTHSDYVADAKLDEQGRFELKLDESQEAGMYRIVYAVPQDEYNFDLIYNAKENIEFSFSADKGLEYTNSTENRLMTTYTSTMSTVSQSIGNFYREQSTDKDAFISLFQTLDKTQTEFENLSKGTLAYNFIRANKPYIAKELQDVSTYVNNVKASYFKHVDFGNEILQSSNFLIDRVLNYVFGMTAGNGSASDIYKSNIDEVGKVMQSAPKNIQAMIFGILWQQLAEARYEEIANYVTDNYLLKLAQDLNDEGILEMIVPFKNTSLGNTAPDFEMESTNGKGAKLIKLSEYNVADTYVLVFWSSVCSHCLEELPQLHKYVSGYEDGKIKVIAFGLEDDEYRWKSETYNLPEFQHVCGLGKWDNAVGDAYNVTSTPTYFVLDKDKKILAKPENFEDLKRFLSVQK